MEQQNAVQTSKQGNALCRFAQYRLNMLNSISTRFCDLIFGQPWYANTFAEVCTRFENGSCMKEKATAGKGKRGRKREGCALEANSSEIEAGLSVPEPAKAPPPPWKAPVARMY